MATKAAEVQRFQAQKETLLATLRERVDALQNNRSQNVTHDLVWVLTGILSLIETNEMEKRYEDNKN